MASFADEEEDGSVTSADTQGKRSTPAHILDSLKLSWQAHRGLFLLVAIALPALEGLLMLALLVIFRFGAPAFLDTAAEPSQVLDDMLPLLFTAVGVTILMLLSANTRHTVQELLLDRVRQFSTRRMHRAIASLELSDFDDPTIHDRISRAETTADFKPRQVVRGVVALVSSAFQIIFFVGLLVVLQPLLLPMMALAAAPILILSARLAGQQFSFFYNVTALERRRRYVGRLITSRESAAELRSFRLTEHFADRHAALSHQRYAELRRMVRGQWRSLLVGQFSFGLVIAAVMGVIAWFFVSGRMDTVELLTVVVALSRLAGAVGNIGGPITEISEAGLFLGDQNAFYEQTHKAREAQHSDRRPAPLQELAVRNLSFTYKGADREALREIELTIQAGQLVAFVGPNGSGKTTLSKILAFLYPPTEGEVLWNGARSTELSTESLRDCVTTVFQDPLEYHFSVAENVTLGDVARTPDPADIDVAISAAGASDVVARLPDGLETQLGTEFDSGTSLSGGELQRLAIARAFYRSRELVILDEPTSALDAVSDHALLADLRRLLAGRTAIIVSHRFSNVRYADQIFVFNEGRIVERGTHASLMEARGLYAEMYALQANVFLKEPVTMEQP